MPADATVGYVNWNLCFCLCWFAIGLNGCNTIKYNIIISTPRNHLQICFYVLVKTRHAHQLHHEKNPHQKHHTSQQKTKPKKPIYHQRLTSRANTNSASSIESIKPYRFMRRQLCLLSRLPSIRAQTTLQATKSPSKPSRMSKRVFRRLYACFRINRAARVCYKRHAPLLGGCAITPTQARPFYKYCI